MICLFVDFFGDSKQKQSLSEGPLCFLDIAAPGMAKAGGKELLPAAPGISLLCPPCICSLPPVAAFGSFQ